MLPKCECCGRGRNYICKEYSIYEEMTCGNFYPSIHKIKEYSRENSITVQETIELIKLCYK